MEITLTNTFAPPTIIRNDTRNDNHWLQVHLRGVHSNRDGVGVHVRVTAGGPAGNWPKSTVAAAIKATTARDCISAWGRPAAAERIEVRWIGGGRDVIEDVAADRLIHMIEGVSPSAVSQPLARSGEGE